MAHVKASSRPADGLPDLEQRTQLETHTPFGVGVGGVGGGGGGGGGGFTANTTTSVTTERENPILVDRLPQSDGFTGGLQEQTGLRSRPQLTADSDDEDA